VGVSRPVTRLHTERRECMGMEAVASLYYLICTFCAKSISLDFQESDQKV